MDQRKKLLLAIRILGCAAALIWGTYLIGSFRTAEFGQSPRLFLGLIFATSLFVLPAVAIFLLGLPWRRLTGGLVLALTLPILLAEIPASLQERSFQARHRDLPADGGGVHEQRWWPHEHHDLFYRPKTRKWWGGC